jgi:hypothetical protein
MRQGLEEKERV